MPDANTPETKAPGAKTVQKPDPATEAKVVTDNAEEVGRVEAESTAPAAGRAFEQVQLQGLQAIGEVSRGVQQASSDINHAVLDGFALGARQMTRLASCRSLSDILTAQQQGMEEALEATSAGLRGVQDLTETMAAMMQRSARQFTETRPQ